MRHDEDLGILREALDQADEPVQVDVVERRLDLVHQVERAGARLEDREQERERGERPLAAREQRDALHALATRARLDLDPGRERVAGLGGDQPALAAGEQLADQALELGSYVPVGGLERRHDLGLDPLDHLEQIPARAAHVVELAVQEVVALLQRLELAAGEQVHPTEEGEPPLDQLGLALEPGDGVVLGQFGHRVLRLALVALAQDALGVADPALEVAARAVLVLVGLAEPLELGGRLPPQTVHLRLLVRGRPLGGRRGRPRGRPGLEGRLGGGEPLLRVGSGARRLLGLGAERVRVLPCEGVALGAQGRQLRLDPVALAPERLHGDAGLDRRLGHPR